MHFPLIPQMSADNKAGSRMSLLARFANIAGLSGTGEAQLLLRPKKIHPI
jgi:hypothetical protein